MYQLAQQQQQQLQGLMNTQNQVEAMRYATEIGRINQVREVLTHLVN